MAQTQSPTVSDAYNVYRLDAQARRVTPETLRTYKDRVDPFVRWCETFPVRRISDITPSHLRQYFVMLQERRLSSYTVNGAARAIKAFLNFCVREGYLSESPFAKVTTPKVDKRILPAFTVDEAQRLLAACETERDRAIVLFLLDTGVRANELANLNGGDIDTKQGVVRVRQGKGRKDRVTYLGARAQKQLVKYYIQRGTPGEKEPVWLADRSTRRFSASGLRQMLKRVGQAAGVKHCSPHTFRRTFALWSLRAGMNIYHLQRIMGHADIQVLRLYLALVEDDLKEAHQAHGAVDNMLTQ